MKVFPDALSVIDDLLCPAHWYLIGIAVRDEEVQRQQPGEVPVLEAIIAAEPMSHSQEGRTEQHSDS
jgi:hypothetical protein